MNSNSSQMLATRWPYLVWLVIGLAIVLRVWGVWYGLPFCYHKDEYHEVMRALELGAGGFNLERTAKGGFYLLLFLEYGFYFVVLRLLGVVESTREFAEMFAKDPTAFYLMGRVTAAVCGAVTVAACFWLARRAYTVASGLLASVFMAINVLHVDLSRVIGVDVPMTMFAVIALFFAVRIAEEGQRRDYFYGALFAALATTTKLPGVLVVLSLTAAHWISAAKRGVGLRERLLARDLWGAIAVFAVVLVATNPGVLLVRDALSLFASNPGESFSDEIVDEGVAAVAGGRPNLYFYYLSVIQQSMGWPLFVAGFVGVGIAMWRRTSADVILLTFVIANYLAISSTTSEVLYYPRYALPIIAVLSVLAARAVATCLCAIRGPRAAVSVVSVAALVFVPVLDTGLHAYTVAQTDTRTIALEWIRANVASGSAVLIEGGKIAADRGTVPLQDSRESLERRISYWRHTEPRQAKYLELKLAVHDGSGFQLEFVRVGSLDSLEQYLERGIQYFVVRPSYFYGSRRSDASSMGFMRDLRSDPRVSLLKRVDGDSIRQPGPTIEIYGLRES